MPICAAAMQCIETLFRLREKDGGVIRGLDPNIGNPLFNFQNWEIILDQLR